jgi:hypothetical protein
VAQLALVKLQALWVCRSLAWLAVNYEHSWDLGQLGKDDLVFFLDPADDSVCEQVPVPFVFFSYLKA